MLEPAGQPLVWTIPAGLPFARRLASELLRRAHPSTDLADTTILVPTNRAARTLARAFALAAHPRALLLPRITPLGEVGEEELSLGWDDDGVPGPSMAELRPAIGPVHRKLLLTRLVASMRRERAGGALAEAARLASELSTLLDALQNQDVQLADLETLVDEDLAEHWQETLQFLEILRDHWPRILAEAGCMDPVARRTWLLRHQAAAWEQSPPRSPVIVAGSTGSIPAARALISAVAKLPRGEVVLAGLDRTVDAESWETLSESHPQFGLKKLLETLGSDRAQVRDWPGSEPTPKSIGRTRLLAEVMRPAATSHRWPETVPQIDVDAGLDGLQVIEARDSVEEAGAIAVLMREALETPGKTAALVTSDRELASRVRTTLRRWNVEVDDSGGEPLGNTSAAVLFRLAIRAAAGNGRPLDLLALLKHPRATGGDSRHAFIANVRAFEHHVVRRVLAWHELPDVEAELRRQVERRPRLAGLERWFEEFRDRMAPLRKALAATTDASAIVAAHRAFTEWLATPADGGTDGLYADHSGERVQRFVREFEAAAKPLGPIPGGEYPALFDEALAGIAIYPRIGTHPRLSILSPLEARLVSADRVIAGGLVEGSWPRRATPNPWLSRTMQSALGLLTDAHRAGMGAHDFVDAASVPEAFLCFARKTRGNPTIRSRWLTRLNTVLRSADRNLSAPPAIGLWQQLTAPPAYRPLPRPQFSPPLSVRPRRLSVTQVRTLLKEPYATYARHVLGLRALDRPGRRPGPAEFGNAVHEVLERFTQEHGGASLPDDAAARLRALGAEVLARFQPADRQDERWWERFTWAHRLDAIVQWFLLQEDRHRKNVDAVWGETSGEYTFGKPPFTLVARADRIEVDRTDRMMTIVDYKTGMVPKKKDVASGVEPQLPLAGVIAEAGGFPDLPAEGTVGRLVYWKLTGRRDGGEYGPALAPVETSDALAVSLGRLKALIRAFEDPKTAYTATHDPEPYSDYAALARTHEWTLAGLRDPDE